MDDRVRHGPLGSETENLMDPLPCSPTSPIANGPGMHLRESELRYRAVVDNIQIGISVINRKMEIVAVNPYYKQYYPSVQTRDTASSVTRSTTILPGSNGMPSLPVSSLLSKTGRCTRTEKETVFEGRVRNYRVVSCPIKR